MKIAFVLLLSLCFCFLKGSGYSYTEAHPLQISSPGAGFFHKELQTTAVNTDQIPAIIKDHNADHKLFELISLEDDDDSVFSRKQVLTRYFIILAYTSLLLFFHQYLKNVLPFCRHLSYSSSYKYILQRVLRL